MPHRKLFLDLMACIDAHFAAEDDELAVAAWIDTQAAGQEEEPGDEE